MKLTVVLVVLIGILVLACSSAAPAPVEPTPNIDATVEAKLAQERAVDATVEARLKEERASQPTVQAQPTNTPVETATLPPKPTNTSITNPTNTPEPAPTNTPTPVPTPTAIPTPTPAPAPTPTPRPMPTLEPCSGSASLGNNTDVTTFTIQRVPPQVFVGAVQVNGQAATDGTEVSAWVDDVEVARTYANGGEYNILIDVCGDGPKRMSGARVSFKIGGKWAAESGVLVQGGGNVLNLNQTTGIATPTPTALPTPTAVPTLTPTAMPTPTPTPNPYTTLGGVLTSDTTLTDAQSPYLITSTLQIPENVTLHINAGVTLTSQANDMFLVNGKLIAKGTANNKIILDASGGNIFNGKQAEGSMSVLVEHSILRNGSSIWPATGYSNKGSLTLRNSEILDMATFSYIWYPVNDVIVEKNVFSNSAGFSVGGGVSNVFIRNNRFVTKYPTSSFWIRNWACYCGTGDEFSVEFNSFLDLGTAVELQSGYEDAKMVAANNYWGTTDESVIADKIYDANDDITAGGVIPFTPYLTAPHSNTP